MILDRKLSPLDPDYEPAPFERRLATWLSDNLEGRYKGVRPIDTPDLNFFLPSRSFKGEDALRAERITDEFAMEIFTGERTSPFYLGAFFCIYSPARGNMSWEAATVGGVEAEIRQAHNIGEGDLATLFGFYFDPASNFSPRILRGSTELLFRCEYTTPINKRRVRMTLAALEAWQSKVERKRRRASIDFSASVKPRLILGESTSDQEYLADQAAITAATVK
jgi:hypothetical protein